MQYFNHKSTKTPSEIIWSHNSLVATPVFYNEYNYAIETDSTSIYKWTCSPYDSANDKYYLPYFGETSQVFQFTWQSSTVGTTYVYPINSSQLNCTGLVTALEFCYTTTLPSNNRGTRDALNFILLNRQTGNSFEETKTVLVTATPFAASCMSSNPRQCCEVMQFNPQDQFDITSSSNLAIAFGPQIDGRFSTQGFIPNQHPMYDATSYITSVAITPGSRDFNAPIQQPLRLAWLHIGESRIYCISLY